MLSGDKANPVLKEEMHLAFTGMGDLYLNEHRLGKRPRFGGFFGHPKSMALIQVNEPDFHGGSVSVAYKRKNGIRVNEINSWPAF